MFHFCYLTTNKVNGKIYFGKHSTNNVNDGYLGSGTLLRNAIKSHGKENFEVTERWFFETEDDAYSYEAKIVTEAFISRDDTYNLQLGGHRVSHTNNHAPNYRINKKAMTNGVDTLFVNIENIPEYLEKGYKFGRTITEEGKKAMKKRNDEKGCNRTVTIITPDGTEVEVKNYTNFCNEHNLNLQQFSRLVNNKMYSHKGYTLKGSIVEKPERKFKAIVTPDGEFESLSKCAEFYNLTEDQVYNRVHRSKSKKWLDWRYA